MALMGASTVLVVILTCFIGAYLNGYLAPVLKMAPGLPQILFCTLGVVAVLVVIGGIGFLYLASCYSSIIKDNHFDINQYVRDPNPTLKSRAKVAFIHYFVNVGTHKASRTPIKLESHASPFFAGLQVTGREGTLKDKYPDAKPFDGANSPYACPCCSWLWCCASGGHRSFDAVGRQAQSQIGWQCSQQVQQHGLCRKLPQTTSNNLVLVSGSPST
jgi:hypothetical protein